jgi:two-component system sensor histidine kinase ChvG
LRRAFEPPEPPRSIGGWTTNGKSLPEVAEALRGTTASLVRADNETIVSVAAPIKLKGVIKGALVLSTLGRDIDKVIASERFALLRFFGVIAGVMLILSLALANTIAEPVRKLSEAAERVRRGIKSRQPIPDFTNRADEIGHLSRALGEMTEALYSRIDAIESFAADVAHELKNPLTSLRSAVETLPRVKPGPTQDRLLLIVQHDVRRLDRLISDISDASRLDAELARGDAEPVDVAALLDAVVAMLADSPRCRGVRVSVVKAPSAVEGPCLVFGHDSRLAQVITNLVDNACSFSQPGGEVRIRLGRVKDGQLAEYEAATDCIVVEVEDDGPGIPPHALERVFERFYTDRPVEGFGQNSGLGLSISRQIVEAHHGRIWAENRPFPAGRPPSGEGNPPDGAPRHSAGARFIVSLPAAAKS